MPNGGGSTDPVDVVVVGAGLAGLAAAQHLVRAGLQVTVVEADDRIGGRMATDHVDGFRLDRSLQLLNTSYPELRHSPELEGLPLRPFSGDVLVCGNGRRHHIGGSRGAGGAFTTVRALTSAARSPLGGAIEQAWFSTALARLATVPTGRLLARPERTAGEALAARGLPPRIVAGYVRPLLVALLNDPELTTSSRCADLALRSFARGRLCLPAGGACSVPEQLAAGLSDGTVRTGVRAVSVSTTSVRTEEHGELRCRSVLVATGARAAAGLLPGLRLPSFHPVTVLHHTASALPLRDAALLLSADRGRGPVAYTAVVSRADPSRAPKGKVLITSTVLGDESVQPLRVLDKAARPQLGELYGASARHWELIGAHHDPEASPAMPTPHDVHRPVRVLCGLYVCGDHRDMSTPQGALFSGRRAAHALLRDLGKGLAAPPAPAAPVPAAASAA